MQILRTAAALHDATGALRRAGRSLTLVPTMGALHDGHAALMRLAGREGGAVAVSIYVNPAQFGPDEDFARYPRSLDADAALCERAGAEIVFAPADAEMYPDPVRRGSAWIDETELARHFEGERRPGHFRGVCTVVAKLFNLARPDRAVFGQKDFQQLRVIERMVRDLRYPIEIVAAPTIREADGLAMSSRNRYLSAEERAQASVLQRALTAARDAALAGERGGAALESLLQRTISEAPLARIDYAALADAATLAPTGTVKSGQVILLAVFFGKTRLLDNIVLPALPGR